MKAIPLYIHIPFCRSKCSYCSFYSSTEYTVKLEKLFLSELYSQINYYMILTKSDFCKTIYIGGGTPSMLSYSGLQNLLDYLDRFIDDAIVEFTIECNPEDISFDFLKLLKKSKINRISLGVQSFNDSVLTRSGRKCSSYTIETAINLINQHWESKFSVDIISGLPGQTLGSQLLDINKAVVSGADHISCYSLIMEESTPLFDTYSVDQELEDEMWSICNKVLLKNDFVNYEVSNYAKIGYESIHNHQYWQMNEYIGCGPGAVSMIKENEIKRINNTHNIFDYLKGKDKNWFSTDETINPQEFLFENFMMGLRTTSGIDRKIFRKRFGFFPEKFLPKTIKKYSSDTFLIKTGNFALNSKSRLFMNSILMDVYDELFTLQSNIIINWP
ncbi:MAG: radical SAM family heme chaperone HemW [Deltaproteobacteria bacterium]|nr:radical SAM family heme chaperone HemW [Deltaproteobacteria bacterium]